MVRQDTGKFRKNTKDQFYTHTDVSKRCIDKIHSLFPNIATYKWIEPSAGDGAFLHHIPDAYDKVGIDIDPKSVDIITEDFLKWTLSPAPAPKPIIVFGNPPFGRQSSIAKAFIIKSCQFADIIAFILPKSFTKPSMSNAFNIQFHCIYSEELEKNAFVINGSGYDVPCVFQIWEKKEEPRVLEKKIEALGFQYVKSNEKYDIALRRVGGRAGQCYKNQNDGTAYSLQSHYFIKFNDTLLLDSYIESINAHVFPSNTVGPRSLSKSEINLVLNALIIQHRQQSHVS